MPRDYWDTYYSTREPSTIVIPSQFASFIASEVLGTVQQIVEIGCGNGRDALFFARQGFQVVGVDASPAAIELCRRQAKGADARFLCNTVGNPSLAGELRTTLGERRELLIYARFFLHAVDAVAESAFLNLAAGLCAAGHQVAVEFRTKRDQAQTKVTPDHYRRFIDPLEFMATAQTHGFRVAYFVEGFGYAKYKSDDAHVARFILLRAPHDS